MLIGDNKVKDWHCTECSFKAKYKMSTFYHIETRHVETLGHVCKMYGKFCASQQSEAAPVQVQAQRHQLEAINDFNKPGVAGAVLKHLCKQRARTILAISHRFLAYFGLFWTI